MVPLKTSMISVENPHSFNFDSVYKSIPNITLKIDQFYKTNIQNIIEENTFKFY